MKQRPIIVRDAEGLAVALVVSLVTGCTSERAIFVKPGIPVRLAEDIKNVTVYVKNTEGTLVKAKADLYAGMWLIVDTDEWDMEDRAAFMNLRSADD